MKKVSVIGAGSFGMALSMTLNDNGHEVTLWGFDKNACEKLKTTRSDTAYLKDAVLDEKIKVTNDKKEAIEDAEIIVIVVPSSFVRENLLWIKKYCNEDQVIINLAKGFDDTNDLRLSEVIEEILPNNKYAIMSGPSHAEEISKRMSTAIVVASKETEIAKLAQEVFMNNYLRLYTSSDIVGVELGGALKNVIAIAIGITESVCPGDNAKAALMTRGNAEIIKLGLSLGAEAITFAGLSGMGDLIVTCGSVHSRNRRAGMMIGQGKTLQETLKEIGMVVEGVTTSKTAYHYAKKQGLELPIIKNVYQVVFEGKNPNDCVEELMSRDAKPEFTY